MTEEFISDDITFCGSQCDDLDCPRHRSHIIDKELPHSFAMFKHTEDCPHEQAPKPKLNRMSDARLKSVCQEKVIEMLGIIRLIHPTAEILEVRVKNGEIEIEIEDEMGQDIIHTKFDGRGFEEPILKKERISYAEE